MQNTGTIQDIEKRKMMTANRKLERTATCGWLLAVNTKVAPTISDGLGAERTVRAFTLLRKSSMFYGSGKGTESSYWILTMIETAKIHNLNPEDYLRCVFEHAPYCEKTSDWEKILPWNIKITPFQPRDQCKPE